jgi:hypothetical protein
MRLPIFELANEFAYELIWWSWFGGAGGVLMCSSLDPPKELTWEDIGCDLKKHYDMMSISLVNKKFLQQLQGYDQTVHK